jgi:hypothetical protein
MRLKTFFFSIFLFLLDSQTTFAAVARVENGENGFATLDQLNKVFANILSAVSTAAGFGVLIMFIRGGIAYITAQGDPKAVSTARSTLTWAIIGLVVIISAYLIISLLVGFFEIPGLGKFCIPKAGSNPTDQCK